MQTKNITINIDCLIKNIKINKDVDKTSEHVKKSVAKALRNAIKQ